MPSNKRETAMRFKMRCRVFENYKNLHGFCSFVFDGELCKVSLLAPMSFFAKS
jgi:hypothetical protein